MLCLIFSTVSPAGPKDQLTLTADQADATALYSALPARSAAALSVAARAPA